MKLWTLISNREEAITATIFTSLQAAQEEYRALVEEDWGKWCPNDKVMPEDTDEAFSQLCDRVGYVDSYHLEEHEVQLCGDLVMAKAAAFFDHVEKAREAGKDWWADALEKMLAEKIEQDRLRDEMLAALKAAERAVDDCQTWRSHNHHRELEQIRAAIAKAEGR